LKGSLLGEIKRVLGLIERLKDEVYGVKRREEGFDIASAHIDNAIEESERAVKEIVEKLEVAISYIQNGLGIINDIKKNDNCIENLKVLERNLSQSATIFLSLLTHLEFQDIMAQRLLKVKGFIADIEKSILKIFSIVGTKEVRENEFDGKIRWDREISQSDVDRIMEELGDQEL
jgi:chemotaxis protein CheZ